MGYPAGIGPEVALKALASPGIRRHASFLIIGDLRVFKKASALIGIKLRYRTIKTEKEIDFSGEDVLFLDMDNLPRENFSFGTISKSCGRASVDYIKKGVSIIKRKRAEVLVTAPIHKHAAELSGFRHPGHTEYLAHLSGTKDYAMMLMGGGLKVVPVTTHLPLKDVPKSLNRKRIIDIISLLDTSLKSHFGVKEPSIAVCGLNPHAGDSGLLGNEEIDIIAPAVKVARRKKINVCGPYAADALFYDLHKGRYDAVICMYHDQGLVALKMLAREESVNITLGLPFIRTSPGHGTALDIAGRGTASAESMKQAIIVGIASWRRTEKCIKPTR